MANLVLEWLDPSGVPNRVAVTRPLTIGRTPDNDIVLDSPQVSRHHCTVAPTPQGIVIDASMSTNGVVIDGRRVKSGGVAMGGAFLVGGVSVAVTQGSAAPPGGAKKPAALLLAVAASAVAVIGLVGVVALALRETIGGSSATNPPPTIPLSDPRAALASLGEENPVPNALDQASELLSRLPPGTEAVPIASPEVKENGDLRLEQIPYEIRSPGNPAVQVVLQRQFVRDDEGWHQMSVLVTEP